MERGWGPVLVAAGVGVTVLGVLAWSGALSWFGRLPGDLRFGGENGRVFVPITSMLLLSIGGSALLNLAFWFFRR